MRTLKDFECTCYGCDEGMHDYDKYSGESPICVGVDELKKEFMFWLEAFRTERTDAISEMFDNIDEYGIYPTTKFFNRIDNFWKNKFNIKEGEIITQ